MKSQVCNQILTLLPFCFIIIMAQTSLFAQESGSKEAAIKQLYEEVEAFNKLDLKQQMALEKEAELNTLIAQAKTLGQDSLYLALIISQSLKLNIDSRFEEMYQKALEAQSIADRNTHLLEAGQVYDQLGLATSRLNKFTESISYHLKTIELHTNAGNEKHVFSPMARLASFYIQAKQYKKAEELLLDGLEILSGLEDDQLKDYFLTYGYYFLGIVYYNQEQIFYAQVYFDTAMELGSKHPCYPFSVLGQFGHLELLLGMKRMEEMYPFIQDVDEIFADLIYQEEEFQVEYSIFRSSYYLHKNIVEEQENPDTILQHHPNVKKNITFYNYAIDYWKKHKDLEKALFYSELKQKEYLDPLKDNALAGALEYETISDKQSKDNEKLSSLFQRNRSLTLFLIALLLIALFLSFLWYRRYARSKSKAKALAEENQKTIDELTNQKAEKEQSSKVFSNISHELKTPLTLIKGPVKGILTSKNLDEETRKTLHQVLNSSEKLLKMSRQLADLAKNEVTILDLHLNRFRLDNFLNYVHSNFSLLSKTKKIQLRFSNTIPEALTLITDAEKLEAILNNLIGNALKFTPASGKIDVQSNVQEEILTIQVKDTGPGIAEEELKLIFDRHYQTDQGATIPDAGYGIGLAICKEYANLLGGTITATSSHNAGSTFSLSIPIQLSNDNTSIADLAFESIASPATSAIMPKNKLLSSGYLLVVEDDIGLCEYINHILAIDYEVVIARNGAEALEVLTHQKPALIITDLIMPVMDGMRLIKAIKDRPDLAHIPLLVLTGKDSILEELKTLRLGADDYLVKPFDEMELKTIVYNLIHHAKEMQANFLLNSELKTSIEQQTMDQKELHWLEALEKNINQSIANYKLDVELLAQQMEMSTSSLHDKMKTLTGFTPKKYIQELRLLKARKLLEQNHNTTVKFVAYEVGFPSEKTFSRNFKARFGKYPSEYLK